MKVKGVIDNHIPNTNSINLRHYTPCYYCRPFSGISRTIPDTQLDNLPSHTGQRAPAGIVL